MDELTARTLSSLHLREDSQSTHSPASSSSPKTSP